MESITFAAPSLATAEMARQDQLDMLLNQATAVIVCCYLEHMNAAIAKGISGATSTAGGPGTAFLTKQELVSLVDDVQAALRSIP